ncbi:S1 family peptidase [Pseudonocardiaceae bacterium YIM PH 21723]|nr:S1 family peptidase [Pseudonocardiaceae bacterium YIM PH 21723]
MNLRGLVRRTLIAGAIAALVLPVANANADTRQWNGTRATQAEAPWAVALLSNGSLNCSGAIINANWVLTAKHCDRSGYEFRVGNVDYSKGAVRKPVKTVLHPTADLVLYKLDQPVQTTYARLASAQPKVGDPDIPYGFGRTNSGSASQYLLKSNMQVSGVGSDRIQAKTVDGSYTMPGDSGGPILSNGIQIGVHYGGDQTGNSSHTNVATYRSWIDSNAV